MSIIGITLAFMFGHFVDGWVIAGDEQLRVVYEVCKEDATCDTGFFPLTGAGRSTFAIAALGAVALSALLARRRR
jgi:LPXTG-motif cell wall-anchored protein